MTTTAAHVETTPSPAPMVDPCVPGDRRAPRMPRAPRTPVSQARARQAGPILARLTGWFFTLILVAAALVFGFLAIGPHVAGYRTVTMLSGSMKPGIRPGDVVVVTPEPLQDVAVGQIITFHTPTATQYVDSHRVVAVQHGADGAVLVRTKGDANPVADPWLAQLHGATAWRVRGVIPRLGVAIHSLRSPAVHAVFQWVFLGLLGALLLTSIWRTTPPQESPASRLVAAPAEAAVSPAAAI